MKKILFYTNQFFGQIGGEDMAYAEPQVFEGMHGSANTFGAPLKDIAEIVATIVCGDNFYAENMETGRAFRRVSMTLLAAMRYSQVRKDARSAR